MRYIYWKEKSSLFSSVILGTFLAASAAQAFIDGEVELGARTGAWQLTGQSAKSLSASGFQLSSHLDPIPLVPVSFGLRYISESYSANLTDHGVNSLTSWAVVPELTGWLPLGDLKPFARVGYTLLSAYKGTAQTTIAGVTNQGTVYYKSNGVRISAGVEWSLLPLISLTAAIEHSLEKISLVSGTINGFDMTINAPSVTYVSNAVLVGVKAGL